MNNQEVLREELDFPLKVEKRVGNYYAVVQSDGIPLIEIINGSTLAQLICDAMNQTYHKPKYFLLKEFVGNCGIDDTISLRIDVPTNLYYKRAKSAEMFVYLLFKHKPTELWNDGYSTTKPCWHITEYVEVHNIRGVSYYADSAADKTPVNIDINSFYKYLLHQGLADTYFKIS